jgi:hypothetical protein
LTKKNTTVAPPTPLFSVSPIEDKTESRHFNTNEVMEAELLVVLNTLTEDNFQEACGL